MCLCAACEEIKVRKASCTQVSHHRMLITSITLGHYILVCECKLKVINTLRIIDIQAARSLVIQSASSSPGSSMRLQAYVESPPVMPSDSSLATASLCKQKVMPSSYHYDMIAWSCLSLTIPCSPMLPLLQRIRMAYGRAFSQWEDSHLGVSQQGPGRETLVFGGQRKMQAGSLPLRSSHI